MTAIALPILTLTTRYQTGVCWQLVDNKNSPAAGGVSILVKWTGLALHYFVQLRLNAIKISAA